MVHLLCSSPTTYKVHDSIGVVFDGLSAELATILDSFLPIPQLIT